MSTFPTRQQAEESAERYGDTYRSVAFLIQEAMEQSGMDAHSEEAQRAIANAALQLLEKLVAPAMVRALTNGQRHLLSFWTVAQKELSDKQIQAIGKKLSYYYDSLANEIKKYKVKHD